MPASPLKPADLRRLRSAAQLLAGPPPKDLEAVVRRHLAVQAQDLKQARLALRARVPELTAADVDRALTEERSFVISSLMRGTLHFVRPDDLPWLRALVAPALERTAFARLAQEGIDQDRAERALKIVDRALAGDGPLTRRAIGDRLAAGGVQTPGYALGHVLFLAAYRGIAVRGPVLGNQHAYVRTGDWLGRPPKPAGRDRALAELARRYLAGFGPATAADLAYWAGLPVRDARAGLNAIARELAERGGGLVDLAGRDPAPATVPAKLLARWDNYLLGWKDRGFQLAPQHSIAIYANGMIGPAAARGGRIVGRWAERGGRVELEPFGTDGGGFTRERRDVERFLAR